MAYRKFYQKNTFLGGEASGLVEGRSDLPQYKLGSSKIENFIVLKTGGITRRPGTRYVDDSGIATGSGGAGKNLKPRLIPFTIGTAESYVLEITSDDSSKTTYRIIQNTNTPSVSFSVTYTGPDFKYFTSSELQDIQYANIGAYLFLTHPTHKTIVVQRVSTSSFNVTDLFNATISPLATTEEWFRIPYGELTAKTGYTLAVNTASVGTGRTITFSSAYLTGTSSDVGRYFYLDTGYLKITAAVSTTQATVTVLKAIGSTAASSDWREGAWNEVFGYPRAVGVYNQRLILGGSTFFPDSFWASQVADYVQFWTGSTGATDPLNEQLASDQYNDINWIVGGKTMNIGTSSGEWICKIEISGTSITKEYKQETSHGSHTRQARRVGYTTMFLSRNKRTFRELAFNFDNDKYVATDLNIFASHIGSGSSLTNMDWQESLQCMWTFGADGKLYGFTRDREQQIAAWHSHVLGGTRDLTGYGGAITDPFVESIAIVHSPENDYDRVFLAVSRSVNGVIKYHVEWMDKYVEEQTTINPSQGTAIYQSPAMYLDCMKIFNGSGSEFSTITGMTAFASSTVYVVAASGAGGVSRIVYAGELAVNSSGEIAMPTGVTTSFAWVGYLANARVNTLPLDGGDPPEVIPGANRRVDQIKVRFKDTYGLDYGAARTQKQEGVVENTTVFDEIPFYETSNTSETSSYQKTFTGTKTLESITDYDEESGIAFLKSDPWPCTILSLTCRLMVNEI